MNKKSLFLVVIGSIALFAYCTSGKKSQSPISEKPISKNKPQGLKDYYKDYFTIGVAVSPKALRGSKPGHSAIRQSNPRKCHENGPNPPQRKRV